MKCIYCEGNTSVTNSRHQKRSNAVWRRRQCTNCGSVFTTHELADFSGSWRFIDKDGAMEPFIREKLLLGLYDSLKHRPTALEDATELTNTAISVLSPILTDGFIAREQIIETCGTILNNFDTTAAVHYRAFHRV
jgi:transcriptional regulator NrdR family protein